MAIKKMLTRDTTAGVIPPAVSSEEEEEEKLTGLARLDALGTGGSKPNTSASVPVSGGKKLSGLDRLNALGTTTIEPAAQGVQKLGPTVVKATDGGTDWGEKGRYRPSGAVEGYTAPAWMTDSADELEALLDDYGGRLTEMETILGSYVKPLKQAEGKVKQAGSNLKSIQLKADHLNAAMTKGTPEEQRRALMEWQAFQPYYQRYIDAYDRALAEFNEIQRQAKASEYAYNTTLQDMQHTLEQYDTVRSGSGDRAKQLRKEGDELARQAAVLSGSAEGVINLSGMTGMPDEWSGSFQNSAEALNAQAREKFNQADKEEARSKEWQIEQLFSKYGYDELRQKGDWAAKSAANQDYLTPKAELGELKGLAALPSGAATAMFGDEDSLNYAIINGSAAALDVANAQGSGAWGALSKNYLSNKEYLYPTTDGEGKIVTGLTEDERALYNYLYATDKKKAAEFLDEITPLLTGRQRTANKITWQKYAEESPAAASAFSVLISPTKAISRIMQMADMLATGKPDENAAYNQFSHIPTDIRAQVSETIEKNWAEKGREEGTGSFLYQTGMSMADFLWNALLTGDLLGGGTAEEAGKLTLKGLAKGMTRPSIVLMGLEAAADSYISNRERGLDHGRAYILSAASGLIEALTENISLELLLNPVTLKSKLATFMVNLGENALAEGSEELSSDLLNWSVDAIYDAITGMDESEYKQKVRQSPVSLM